MDKIIEFLRESNAIEGVYDENSLNQALFAWEYLKKQDTLTTSIILNVHKILMLHSNLYPNEKGYFRNCEVRVGGEYGLTYERIPHAIGNWCYNTMHARKSAKKLHIEFEKIHPFVDGNGRIGRMLMNWTHLRKGQPILIIKPSERQEYYNWFK